MIKRLQAINTTPLAYSEKLRVPKALSMVARDALIALLLLISIICLQAASGSFTAEFSGPDEGAHYVTALMIRQYLTTGSLFNPLKFAKNYYVHYPEVAFGVWPPLFHFVEATWMLLFTAGRASMLILMAMITAIWAFLLYRLVADEFGALSGICIGLLGIMLPAIQISADSIMADNLVALLDFGAAIAFARYLTTERTRDSLLFGLLATLSMLTKENGLALLLFPFAGVIFARKIRLAWSPAFWYPFIMVLLIAGPWNYHSLRIVATAEDVRPPRLDMMLMGASGYATAFESIFGGCLSAFILFGLYTAVARPRREAAVKPLWASAAALVIAVFVFDALLPKGSNPRYLIGVIAPALLFLPPAVRQLGRSIPIQNIAVHVRILFVATIVGTAFLLTGFKIPPRNHFGFSALAERLSHRPDFRGAVLLISSEGTGESMFISEIAMRENTPECVVLRSSKVLSQSNWDGQHYKLLFETPAQLMRYMDTVGVNFVVIDNTSHKYPQAHQALLKRSLASFPNRFQLLGTFSDARQKTSDGIQLFRIVHRNIVPSEEIEVNMPYTLGGTTIELRRH